MEIVQEFLDACASDEAAVRHFLANSGDIPNKRRVITTGMLIAMEAGRWGTVILLIQNGADSSAQEGIVLIRAVQTGNEAIVDGVLVETAQRHSISLARTMPPALWTSILQNTPRITEVLRPVDLFSYDPFVARTLARMESVDNAYIQDLFLFIRGDLPGLQTRMQTHPGVINLHDCLSISLALTFSADDEFIRFVIDNIQTVDNYDSLALYLAVSSDRPLILGELMHRSQSVPDDLLVVAIEEESDATAAFLVQSNYPYEAFLQDAILGNDHAALADLVDAGISPRALNDMLVPMLLDAINENEEIVPIVRSLLVRDLAGLHRHQHADVRAAAQRELATLARLHRLLVARQGRYAEPGIAVAILEAMGYRAEDVRYARDLFQS